VYASFISSKILRFSYPSFAGRLVVKGLVFLVSGIIHAIVRGRYICGWYDEIAFFLLNFLAIILETAVQAAAKVIKGKDHAQVGMVQKSVGGVWIFGFLVWIIPLMEFRKEQCHLK
jgi:hypothetical protein